MNFVATDNEKIIGTILCGHDARRGYLYHLIVDKNYRKKGIGKLLVKNALDNLKKIGITKFHIFVFDKNIEAKKFWGNLGWEQRKDINIFSLNLE